MARPTLSAHPKFAKLVARLRGTPLPRAAARGALELIWDAGYGSGDPFIGDAEAVEAIVDWTGTPGDLAGHLVAVGFLDRDESGGHYIHDLADHAPDYVARRMAREQERKANGTSISSIRSAAACKRKTDATNDSKRISFAANVDPPAPAPAPDLNPPNPLSDDSQNPEVGPADPLTATGIIAVIRGAIEASHPELGLYNRGRWALDRATRFLEEVPHHKRNDDTRAEIRSKVRAFAASKDPWIKSKGWSVEAFFDRYASFPAQERGPPRELVTKYRDRPQLPAPIKATNGSP